MKTRAAVLYGQGQDWKVEEIDLDPPKAGEVLIEMRAAGLCHSEEHLVTGDAVRSRSANANPDAPSTFPLIGGHEGCGVVTEVGAGVTMVAVGDLVATSFIPSCGRCRWCVTGHSNLCDLGAAAFEKGQITDKTSRHFCGGQELNLFAKLGTFSDHTVVAESSVVKVDPDLPPAAVALVSCGVATGWGSAVLRAGTQQGDTVVVIGTGGVGMNAVQGARMASAANVVAVEPVEFKREAARGFGATHVAASISEALPLVTELTRGRMAERVILTPSVLHGDLLAPALQLTGKNGTCVVTAIAPMTQTTVDLSLFELAMWQKELKGTIFGSANPRFDIPNLLSLYRSGSLLLDELVTRTYDLDDINQGYEDMRSGANIRGVISY